MRKPSTYSVVAVAAAMSLGVTCAGAASAEVSGVAANAARPSVASNSKWDPQLDVVDVIPGKAGAWATGGTSNGTILRRHSRSGWSTISFPYTFDGQPSGPGKPAGEDFGALGVGSASVLWTVGSQPDGGGQEVPMIWRLHGSNLEPVAIPAETSGRLVDIDASSPTNAWAVGSYASDTDEVGWTLHWTGTSWQTVPVPGNIVDVYQVKTTSPSNAWALGNTLEGDDSVPLHWNGTQWAAEPYVTPRNVYVDHIATGSAHHAYLIGHRNDVVHGRAAGIDPYVVSRSGSTWVRARLPKLHNVNIVTGSAAGSAAFLVGTSLLSGLAKPVVVQLSHGKWRVAKSAHAGAWTELLDVSADSPRRATAVGFMRTRSDGSGRSKDFAETYNGRRWRRSLP